MSHTPFFCFPGSLVIPVLVTLSLPLFSARAHSRTPEHFDRNGLGFSFHAKNNPSRPGVALDQTIRIDPFDVPGRTGVRLPQFRIIFGHGSLAIFDALHADEIAGLNRKDAEQRIRELDAAGETEKNGAFIAGLANVHDGQPFMFFNLTRLERDPYFAYRILSHEPLHLARILITAAENPCVDYLKDPYTKLDDDTEEYFAETLERLHAIAIHRYFKLPGRQ